MPRNHKYVMWSKIGYKIFSLCNSHLLVCHRYQKQLLMTKILKSWLTGSTRNIDFFLFFSTILIKNCQKNSKINKIGSNTITLDDFFPILILILKWYLYYCGHTTPHHVKPIFLQGGFSGELEVNFASISYVFFPPRQVTQ